VLVEEVLEAKVVSTRQREVLTNISQPDLVFALEDREGIVLLALI
jgi:hypothetical protein